IHGRKSRQRLLETVRLLTASDACILSSTGMTPLMQAIDFEDYDVTAALLACNPVLVRQKFCDPMNKQEWNLPVHYAAQLAGRSKDLDSAVEILRLIVEKDLDHLQVLSSTNSRGRTPLHLAVTSQSLRAAEWLINQGADVNAIDKHGRHLLHYVSAAHITDLLLSSGAYLDCRDKDGLSPLHHVCQRDSLDVLNMLI
ncbi:ankyrin repeat-containing domain protein, partial [Trichophaea hybrida]